MRKVVSFDIGGTLINTDEGNGKTANLKCFLEEKGISKHYIDIYFRLRKGNLYEFLEKFNLDYNEIYTIMEQNDNSRLYDDVLPALRKLKELGVNLITISNCMVICREDSSLLELSELLELNIKSYNMHSLKPSSKMFLYAEEYYGVDAQYIHVGDNINSDIVGANNVNWISVFIDRKGQYDINQLKKQEKPNYVIRSLFELEKIIKDLG